MKFMEAVTILSKKYGDELSNERLEMKRYVKKHPEDKLIAEAFEAYIKVVGMPKKVKRRSIGAFMVGKAMLLEVKERIAISENGIYLILKRVKNTNLR